MMEGKDLELERELWNEKYVVFKKEDWLELRYTNPLTDCVVIRLQDIFSTSALYTYANEIATVLEVMEELELHHPAIEKLQEIADYFAAMGDQAKLMSEVGKQRLPD